MGSRDRRIGEKVRGKRKRTNKVSRREKREVEVSKR